MKINKKLIKELVDHLSEFNLTELEYQEGQTKIKVSKVAKGIEKNTPQNPNIVPNKNTARIIIKGCNLTASEKIIGTNKFPSIN